MKSVRFVLPFRPFVAEAPHHQELAAFDWIAAIRMLIESLQRTHPGAEVHVLTDVDTDLPLPTLQYATTSRRLMLWNLEVCAAFLRSADFDRDTIVLDSDQLVYGDLTRWLAPQMDLGICIRKTPKNAPGLAILNGVQFWVHRGKTRLPRFYERALEVARDLGDEAIVWGADTIALERLLDPLDLGLWYRGDLRVRLIDSNEVIEALNAAQIRHLEAGKMRPPFRPVLDFRNTRKVHMAEVYRQTIAEAVPA